MSAPVDPRVWRRMMDGLVLIESLRELLPATDTCGWGHTDREDELCRRGGGWCAEHSYRPAAAAPGRSGRAAPDRTDRDRAGPVHPAMRAALERCAPGSSLRELGEWPVSRETFVAQGVRMVFAQDPSASGQVSLSSWRAEYC